MTAGWYTLREQNAASALHVQREEATGAPWLISKCYPTVTSMNNSDRFRQLRKIWPWRSCRLSTDPLPLPAGKLQEHLITNISIGLILTSDFPFLLELGRRCTYGKWSSYLYSCSSAHRRRELFDSPLFDLPPFPKMNE